VLVLAALVHIPRNLGYVALIGLVGLESSGLPVPGETALITAGVLAQQGHLSIEIVIGSAALAAIVGDNIGYLIGKRVGRTLLERPGRFENRRRSALARGDEFFDRHGAKAVFFGRWIAGLRVWAAWLAGASTMSWRPFFLWNALGGICWATTVGLAAYFLGEAATKVFEKAGLGAAGALVVVAAAAVYWFHRRGKHRRAEAEKRSGSELS